MQLAGHGRLEIAALDHERAAPELGQQAPAGSASNLLRIDRHARRKVPDRASPAVAGQSILCRFFRRQIGDTGLGPPVGFSLRLPVRMPG
jgi:hypothetical protein